MTQRHSELKTAAAQKGKKGKSNTANSSLCKVHVLQTTFCFNERLIDLSKNRQNVVYDYTIEA